MTIVLAAFVETHSALVPSETLEAVLWQVEPVQRLVTDLKRVYLYASEFGNIYTTLFAKVSSTDQILGLHASTIMANTSHQYVGILDPNSIRRSDHSDTWRRYEQFKMTVFIQQKGGVGKTTMSYATAYGLARAGNTVLYVDADSQRNGTISAIAKHLYYNYDGDYSAFFTDTGATDTLLTALR